MKLTKKQKDIVDLASVGGTDKELALLKRIHELEDKIDAALAKVDASVPSLKDIVGSVKGISGEDGHTPTDAELLSLIKPLIPEAKPGKDGHTPTDKELLALIRPLIPEVKNGETPSDARLLSLIRPLIPDAIVVDEVALANTVEAKLEANLPALGTAIRDALELLNGGERLDVSAIQGIEELEKAIETALKNGTGRIGWGAHPLMIKHGATVVSKVARVINFGTNLTATLAADGTITVNASGGGGGGYTVETPTGTVNGSNVTFTVSSTPVYIVVDGITYFENNGYTISGTTITTSVPPTGFIRSFF